MASSIARSVSSQPKRSRACAAILRLIVDPLALDVCTVSVGLPILKPHFALIIIPEQGEQTRVEGTFSTISRLVRAELDGPAENLGLQLYSGVLLKERAREERLFGGRTDDHAAVTSHLHCDLFTQR